MRRPGIIRSLLVVAITTAALLAPSAAWAGLVNWPATANGITKLSKFGLYDSSFLTGTGFNGSILAVAKQSNGSVIVGGTFSSFNGKSWNGSATTSSAVDTPVQGIARLTSGGVLDTTFIQSGIGFNDQVNAIALQYNGDVIVGGNFSAWNGPTWDGSTLGAGAGGLNGLARLDSSGQLLTTFSTGTGFPSGTSINAIAVQSNGMIVVGGGFSSYNGATWDGSVRSGSASTSTVQGVARLTNGAALDTTFVYNGGFEGSVFALAVESNGSILVGGWLTKYRGSAVPHLVRLSNTGVRDSGLSPVFDNAVTAITVQSDGKILVGGVFSTVQAKTWDGSATSPSTVATDSANLVRLTTTGTVDLTFHGGVGFNGKVRAIAVQPDGKVLVGGDFTAFYGTKWNGTATSGALDTENAVGHAVRLTSTGALDTSFALGVGFNGGVAAIAIWLFDGDLISGIFFAGDFTTFDNSLPSWTVSFDANGGSGSVASSSYVIDGPALTLPSGSDLTRDGYSFAGWRTSSSIASLPLLSAGDSYTPTQNITLYAWWTGLTSNVSYDYAGASSTSGGAASYTHGASFTLPSAPTKTGYTFAGWKITGTHATTDTTAASSLSAKVSGYGDVTLTAQWTVQQYTVSFGGNGATSGSQSALNYDYGDPALTLPAGSAFQRPGFDFSFWRTSSTDTGATPLSGGSPYIPTADVTLYAWWSAKTYTVTYDFAGATETVGGATSYNTATAFNLPGTPSKAGYSFAGWKLTGDHATQTTTAAGAGSATVTGYGDVTATAQWAGVTNTVTYDDASATTGSSGGATSYVTGSSFVLPTTTPLRNGYTFAGWKLTGDTVTIAEFGSSVTTATPVGYGNVTLTAQWTGVTNTVTYDDASATTWSSGGATSYVTGSSFALPTTAPLRNGYAFAGWKLTGSTVTTADLASSAVTASPIGYGNVTATAQWTGVSNTVTYDDASATTGSSGGATSYVTGSSFALPTTAPLRNGYAFAGWKLTGSTVTTADLASSAVTVSPVGYGDVLLTAQWTGVSNVVSYDENGATTAHSGGASSYTSGSSFVLPTTAPVRNGYTFAGWKITGEHATEATIPTEATSATITGYGNVTLTAQWTAVTNTVTYDAFLLLVSLVSQQHVCPDWYVKLTGGGGTSKLTSENSLVVTRGTVGTAAGPV
ncbi:MAG: beta strand repeat-containing protein [Microbacteriaceae bacterium]